VWECLRAAPTPDTKCGGAAGWRRSIFQTSLGVWRPQGGSDYQITSLEFDLSRNAGLLHGGFIFDQPVEAKDLEIVLKPYNRENPDPAEKQLKTWAEALEAAEEEARRRIGVALESLRTQLRKRETKHDGSASEGLTADFLGITGIADVGGDFQVEVNPAGLLPGDGSDDPIFRAHAKATFKGEFHSPFLSKDIDAMVGLDVELTRDDALHLLPRFDLPDAPHFDLIFPKLELTKWSLDQLRIPLDRLQFLQFPTRDFATITTAWCPSTPDLSFTISNGKLNLATTPARVELPSTEPTYSRPMTSR
jgi:hypothetical protein